MISGNWYYGSIAGGIDEHTLFEEEGICIRGNTNGSW